MKPRIVLDTNVLVSALRSSAGACFRLLSLIDSKRFILCTSVPLVLEYEAATKDDLKSSGLTATDIDDLLDYLCLRSEHFKVYYLWRPFLRDPKDDMVLELAVAAGAGRIVTYNRRDFQGCQQFKIQACTPKAFLQEIGELV